jgi:hypothetical protein
MKEKKLQVFVSSTYTDLIEERQAAVEAILSAGHIPAGMELFTAGDASQMTVIKRWIDESDIYLLVLGGRYGSIEKASGKSYTQLEYEYAQSINKPLFAVVITEKALDKKAKEGDYKIVTERDNPQLLQNFKSQVLNYLVKFWDDKKDIKLAVLETISEFSHSKKDLIGWVRGDQSVNAGLLAEEIARLTKENSELRLKLNDFSKSADVRYSGLAYQQLEMMIKTENCTIDGAIMTLYDFMFTIAEQLASIYGVVIEKNNEAALSQLYKYRLVSYTGGRRCIFSEDGHSFYLKAISLGQYPKELNNISTNLNN